MKRTSKFYLALLVAGCLINRTHAQVRVLEKNVLAKIKDGNTHVILGSLTFPDAQSYADVFEKYWTVTKGIDVIEADKVAGNLVEGDSYFSLEAEKITSNYGTAIFMYLNLWQPTKKMLRDKKFKINHEEALAHIQLSVDIDAVKDIYFNSVNFNLDGDNHFYHWNPGLVKNYLQLLCSELQLGKKTDYHDDMTDKSRIKDLSTKTLYYPEDNLYKMGMFVKAGKTVDTKDLFDGYKFNYKVISDKELGEKILKDDEHFYYFLFIRDSGSKLLLVVDSHTGDVIYSRFSSAVFGAKNVSGGDLKDLYKAANKN
ncbi:MAG: hypothetical protein ACXVIY_09020 [Mucilaginibacter sp.]